MINIFNNIKLYQTIFVVSSIMVLIGTTTNLYNLIIIGTLTGIVSSAIIILISNDINKRIRHIASPNKLKINKVEKVYFKENKGHLYSIKFSPVENKPFNRIEIDLNIISEDNEILFLGISGISTYEFNKNIISENKKMINYQFSMRSGHPPMIGFLISKPSKLKIKGNYSLKEQEIDLNNFE